MEFDQTALTKEGCCRFVPVVLRICGIPENTLLTVVLERVRKPGEGHGQTSSYEPHPYSEGFLVRSASQFPGYREYAGFFLARAHDKETGTIIIRLESSHSNVLTEATFRLDSRERQPVLSMQKGRLKAIRFLPQLRTAEERAALAGRYPTLVYAPVVPIMDGEKALERTSSPQMLPLFPVEERLQEGQNSLEAPHPDY